MIAPMPFNENNNSDNTALIQLVLARQDRIETKIDGISDRMTVIERNQAPPRSDLPPLTMLWFALLALLAVVAIVGLIYVGGGGRFGGG